MMRCLRELIHDATWPVNDELRREARRLLRVIGLTAVSMVLLIWVLFFWY